MEDLVRLVEHFPGELLVVVLVTGISPKSGEYSVIAAEPPRDAKTVGELKLRVQQLLPVQHYMSNALHELSDQKTAKES